MKINELLNGFEIFITNEEREVLDKMEGLKSIDLYDERERFVIENLIRKSLVSKVRHNTTYLVKKND